MTEYKEQINYPDLTPLKLANGLLPSAPVGEVHIVEGHAYRLQKISEIQAQIEQEREKRVALSKKYHRGMKGIVITDGILTAAGMGLGVAGIGLLSTIIAAPITIALETVAVGMGVLSIIGNQVHRKLGLKAEKHEKIKILAESKLNTISDHISKALKDNHISDDEFKLILDELDKFNTMKDEIRTKVKVKLDEETKKSLINQGKEDAMKQVQSMLQYTPQTQRKQI